MRPHDIQKAGKKKLTLHKIIDEYCAIRHVVRDSEGLYAKPLSEPVMKSECVL
jgi:hypothetical protein